MIPFISRIGKAIKTENRLLSDQGWRKGEGENTSIRYEVHFGVLKMFWELDSGDG